jgi:hypothetical protein
MIMLASQNHCITVAKPHRLTTVNSRHGVEGKTLKKAVFRNAFLLILMDENQSTGITLLSLY